jgi:hypothetical protein
MSAYNPPKSQPPVFDTTQFDNSEEENYLQFPIAQGDQTMQNVLIKKNLTVNGTITTESLNGISETTL